MSSFCLEHQIHGTNACNCSIPCTRYLYDATLSNSLLDTYKIKQLVTHNKQSDTLLPKHTEALEISTQVRDLDPTPCLINLDMYHFSYACKMRYPLNLVLENLKYLQFYLTFWVVISYGGLKLRKLSIITNFMLQK